MKLDLNAIRRAQIEAAERIVIAGLPPELLIQKPTAPEMSRESRAMLLNVLWHHQGGSSPVGQPLRKLLGIGQHDHLTEEQYSEAKWIDGLLAKAARGVPAASAVPPGWPEHLGQPKPGDWPEDATNENGCYQNHCVGCGHTFTGHKRRIECKVCATPSGGVLPSDGRKE